METATKTFEVPAPNMARLEKRVASLARRSERLGCGPIVLAKVADAQRILRHKGRPDRILDIYVIEVSGPAPKLPGWTFAGTLEHLATEEGEPVNILRTIVEGVPESFRSAKPWCTHCNVDRRWKDTYLVVHDESGEWKQVGRRCIADFLGHKDAEALAQAAQWMVELEVEDDYDEEFVGGGGRGDYSWPLEVFLGHCYDAMAERGFVSRKAADVSLGRPATSDSALRALLPSKDDPPYEKPSDAAMVRAVEAAEWARELDPGSNDFLWNVNVVGRLGRVQWKTAGIAAAICSAYERAMGRAAEQAHERAVSEHFGTPGKRERFELTVVRRHTYETMYGDKTLVAFRDAKGNCAIWRATGIPDLEVGHVYAVKATVKAHGDYHEVKQTELQRLKVEEDRGNPRAVALPEVPASESGAV